MDPDCGAYLTDEKGILLGVAEIRRRPADLEPLVEHSISGGQSAFADARATTANFIRGVS